MRLKFHGDGDDIRLVGRDDCELMDVSGWGADSYYVESIGHISEETIRRYIEDQKKV